MVQDDLQHCFWGTGSKRILVVTVTETCLIGIFQSQLICPNFPRSSQIGEIWDNDISSLSITCLYLKFTLMH